MAKRPQADFNEEPVADVEQPDTQSAAAKTLGQAGNFLNNLRQFATQQEQAEQQQRQDRLDKEAQQEAMQAGMEEGREAAEEGESPELREDQTIYGQAQRKAALDSWQSQTRLEVQEKARELYEQHETEPEKFLEKFQAYQKGIEEKLPEEAIPRFRNYSERRKRHFFRQSKKNFEEINQAENENQLETYVNESQKFIRDVAAKSVGNPNAVKDVQAEFAETLQELAKYGPPGEFELAGEKFEGGNNTKSVKELKSMYDRLRKSVASEFVLSRFKQIEDPEKRQQYIDDFAKDAQREQGEQKIKTGTSLVLNDPERDKILAQMKQYNQDIQTVGKQKSNQSKNIARRIEDQLLKGQPANDEEFNRVMKNLSAIGDDEAIELKQRLKRAKMAQPVAQQSWSFISEEQFEKAIQQRQQKVNSESIKSSTRNVLNEQIKFLEQQKSKFTSMVNDNLIKYGKKQGQKILDNYNEEELRKMANSYGMSKDELKNRMTVEDLQFEPVQDEDGDIVGVSENTLNFLQQRMKDAVFVSKRFDRNIDVFTEGEQKKLNRFLGRLDAEQKNQVKSVIAKGMNSTNSDIQSAAYKTLEELSGKDDEQGNPVFVQSAAISMTNPEAGKNVLIGQEVRNQSAETLVPGVNQRFDDLARKILVERLGKAKGMEVPTEKVQRVKLAAKNLAAYDAYQGNIDPAEGTDKTQVRKYVDKALGSRNGKGGTGYLSENKVVLPPNLNQEEANSWVKKLAWAPKKQDGSETKILLDEFASAVFGADAQELAQYSEYDRGQRLGREELSELMNKIGDENLKISQMEGKSEFTPEDAGKVIRKFRPNKRLTDYLFGDEKEPFRKLSMNNEKPVFPAGEDFTVEDYQKEFKEGTLDFVSTAQDGVYFLEIRDSFVLKNQSGGNYRFDMRKLQGKAPNVYGTQGKFNEYSDDQGWFE